MNHPKSTHLIPKKKFHVSQDDLGVFDGVNGTFGDFLTANKVKPPETKVCYHTCSQDPDGAWIWEKEWDHRLLTKNDWSTDFGLND